MVIFYACPINLQSPDIIEFNPQKSINCQAEAVAIYVSLHRQGLLKDALKGKDEFLEIVYPTYNQTTNIVNQQIA